MLTERAIIYALSAFPTRAVAAIVSSLIILRSCKRNSLSILELHSLGVDDADATNI